METKEFLVAEERKGERKPKNEPKKQKE